MRVLVLVLVTATDADSQSDDDADPSTSKECDMMCLEAWQLCHDELEQSKRKGLDEAEVADSHPGQGSRLGRGGENIVMLGIDGRNGWVASILCCCVVFSWCESAVFHHTPLLVGLLSRARAQIPIPDSGSPTYYRF